MNSSTVFAGLCSPNCERPFCAWNTSCQACQSPSGNWNCCEMCDKLGPFVNWQIDNTCWIIENYCDSQHAFSLYPSGCSRSLSWGCCCISNFTRLKLCSFLPGRSGEIQPNIHLVLCLCSPWFLVVTMACYGHVVWAVFRLCTTTRSSALTSWNAPFKYCIELYLPCKV